MITSPISSPPSSILIVGSGVFGLSTALALSRRPRYGKTRITVVDKYPFPSPDGSSIDSSRIIRADYSDPAYAELGAEAQAHWRGQWGAEGRYSESGLVFVADAGKTDYVHNSFENVQSLEGGKDIIELKDRAEIEKAAQTGGGSGAWGYLNRNSGWADAEAAMRYCHRLCEETGRIDFKTAHVTRLLYNNKTVIGVHLRDSSPDYADVTILATGAWTGSLIDLRSRASATGQVLTYLSLTTAEQARLENMPVLLNFSTGMFIIPPRNRILKVARHAYGYTNPVHITHPESESEAIEVSLPQTHLDEPSQWVPVEGQAACRAALTEMVPSLADRPFSHTRICWYNDTPTGDFLVTYHPTYSGLFLATGGSGHAFKFLPIIGEKVVDCIEGNVPAAFKEKWGWRTDITKGNGTGVVVAEDGSRGGRRGMVLDEEMRKGSRL